jgi:hypothetical protein
VKIGEARLSDCIHVSQPIPEDSEWYPIHDKAIVIDHSYRYKVTRWAISDARKSLSEIGSDFNDFYLP